ncbi:unnamed protein product [Litomosoides sigmodontis]|uniref:DM domain-containing protein n=1 Tax=Litomosoides sigmodontis TaxID=42156 RepID=A0A3P6VDV6_LITSI|nr:unnamed protein product [Litomosoides sigmodontis]
MGGTSPRSSGNSSSGCYSSCSTPEEVDVVAFTPRPQPVNEDDQKRYFCQRCLNHAEEHPRKGHKPFCQHVIDVYFRFALSSLTSSMGKLFEIYIETMELCKYANCECADCHMVEERRRLNNMLSLRRLDPNHAVNRSTTGKKIRDPKCALCSAHGNKQPLRGHKKAQCPFLKCGCHLCGLVENRRTLMARQIKLRRDQQKQRKAQLSTSERITVPINNGKIEEPVRVPPLLPVFPKPSIMEPRPPVPIIFQPTAILPTPPPPMFISPMDNIDLRLMSLNYHHMMNPIPFQFAPMLPYAPTLSFLSAP